jgi:hypothetical protein
MAAEREQLNDLALDRDLDALLKLFTLEDIADAWCRYQARPHIYEVDEEDPDEWAMLLVADIDGIEDEPNVRALLDLLLERAPNDEVVEMVGASPLEAFVKGHTEDRLVWIEKRAGSSARFRQALARVWIWRLEPEVFARVERAAGVPLNGATDDVIDIVAGDLPGTIRITRNGFTISEIETEPEFVDDTIADLKRDL